MYEERTSMIPPSSLVHGCYGGVSISHRCIQCVRGKTLLFWQPQMRVVWSLWYWRFSTETERVGLPSRCNQVRTPVLYFSAVSKSLCFRVETTSDCSGCVWVLAFTRRYSPDCKFSACVQHMFSNQTGKVSKWRIATSSFSQTSWCTTLYLDKASD